jgi:DNA-binding MarR family transcriptional regulator
MTDQRPIGFWLKLVDRLIDERFAETLDEHGVTRRQWQLLTVLSRGTATLEQLDLAVAPFLEPGSTESSAEHLSELIESGWVDATASGYETTERGQGAYERLAEVVSANRAKASEGITEEEYRDTIDVLERLAINLGYTTT